MLAGAASVLHHTGRSSRRSSGRALSQQVPVGKTSDTPGSKDLFAQPPFRADPKAVADNQHTDKRLRIDRRSSRLTVKGCQVFPNPIELDKAIDRTQQMCLGYMPFARELIDQSVLLDLPLPHHRLPPSRRDL